LHIKYFTCGQPFLAYLNKLTIKELLALGCQ
jgi:hypothetical protein